MLDYKRLKWSTSFHETTGWLNVQNLAKNSMFHMEYEYLKILQAEFANHWCVYLIWKD